MLRELTATNPRATAARPEEFVDLTVVKELDSSGFIDRLYMTQPVVASREDQRSTQGPAGVKEKSLLTIEKRKPSLTAAKSVGPAFSDSSREYVVETGDTLSHIALKYYGNRFAWEKIYEANKAIMKNPNYIYVGQRIIIPS